VPRRGTIIRILLYLAAAGFFYWLVRPNPEAEFITAAHSGDIRTVEASLAAGLSPNTRDPGIYGNGPVLHVAAESGQAETITLLIAAGAEVDAPDSRGMTALMYAAQAGEPEAAQALLDHGASTRRQNSDGQTALQIAEHCGPSSGHTQVRRILRQATKRYARWLRPGLALTPR
jgi:hypothetical protein